MPLSTRAKCPIIVSRDLGLGLVVHLDIQCHLTCLRIAKISVYNWQTWPRTFGRPFGESSWSPHRTFKAIQKTQGIMVGREFWPYAIQSSTGAVHALSWCPSIPEKADFSSRLHCLYWPNLHQLQWELRCLDLIWTPYVRCQNFVILISHWIATCVYWVRSHRPQVEKGTITMSCASQRSQRHCFLLRILKKTGIYPVFQDNVCYEKAWLQEHKGCKVQTKKATV